MKNFNLNIWQKIGIALSILWIVFTWVNETNKTEKAANDFANFSYKTCLETKNISHHEDCQIEKQENLLIFLDSKYLNAGAASFLPIPFAWLLVFIFYYYFKSTFIGYKQIVVWKKLSPFHKIFTVFCLSSFGLVILFSILVALNSYVDSEVPVSLPPFVDVHKYVYGNEVIVDAAGTWTGSGIPFFMDSILSHSEIKCSKSKQTCLEAKAYLSGESLESKLIEYPVIRWTDISVLFKNEMPCYEELFTIDLITKKVSGIGKTLAGKEGCLASSSSDKNWDYQLSDGFKVYREERQKARPWLMRVIESFFGS